MGSAQGTIARERAASLLDESEELGASLPEAARAMFVVMTEQLEQLNDQIALLDKEISKRAREDASARQLMTIPGIGPITATAILALAPPPESFAKDRDFAAWLGLTPRQHSSGGKDKLGLICGITASGPEVVGRSKEIEGGYGTTVGETGPEEPALPNVPRARNG